MRIIVDYNGAIGWAEKVQSPIEGEGHYYRILFLDDCIPADHQLREGIEDDFGYLMMNAKSLPEKEIEILKPNQKYIDLWAKFRGKINGKTDSRFRIHIKDTFFPVLVASGAVGIDFETEAIALDPDGLGGTIQVHPVIDGVYYELHLAADMARAFGEPMKMASSFHNAYWDEGDRIGKFMEGGKWMQGKEAEG